MLDRVVVLAGGQARRMGQDKLAAQLAGVRLLDHLLDGLSRAAPGVPVVAVGPRRPTSVPVRWVRERPVGGGPVAAVARALEGLADGTTIGVLAGDQPFAAQALPLLAAALTEAPADGSHCAADCAVAVDAEGVRQPLLGVYRVAGLRAALQTGAAGRSMRSVLASLQVVQVPVPAPCTLDVDTLEDLTAAQQWVGPGAQVPPTF